MICFTFNLHLGTLRCFKLEIHENLFMIKRTKTTAYYKQGTHLLPPFPLPTATTTKNGRVTTVGNN